MVEILRPGINDKVVDPAMGTGDFLTAAMQYRFKLDDGTVISRVYGMDKDPQAYELATVNMILNKDGQTYLQNIDSIENYSLWQSEMGIALCNPPFGSRTLETRSKVLAEYDLGHVWIYEQGIWRKTDKIMDSQQLGILFIERCYKLLVDGGRMGIILPEGYLCTATYGYVRQWLLEKFKIFGLVELPRRIFLKSEADLRSNIVFAIKADGEKGDYPIHTELVRKVGYKLGKGFWPIPLRDIETGLEQRDEKNKLIIDSDFIRVKKNFINFINFINLSKSDDLSSWQGARLSDIKNHPQLDMKPRRLNVKALSNIRNIKSKKYVRLMDVADVIETTVDLSIAHKDSELINLIEGQDIRAAEGVVVLKDSEKRWMVEVRKTSKAYSVKPRDVIIGLVRPERRNIGFFIQTTKNVYASPDGVAVVREKKGMKDRYPIEWIFHALRTEQCRIQFWTESGGTSYGKLNIEQIKNVMIQLPNPSKIKKIADNVIEWSVAVELAHERFHDIWDNKDKVVILNSPIIGLESDSVTTSEGDEDDD